MAHNIVRFNPLAEMDALQRQFFGDDLLSSFNRMNVPTTDVYTEGDNRLVVEAHLPNFDENDINISVDEGALVIQAEKRERQEDKERKYMVRESSTSFYRRIVLPERADENNVKARFENGVLRVEVPFTEQTAPRKITISSGSSSSPAIDREPSSQQGDSPMQAQQTMPGQAGQPEQPGQHPWQGQPSGQSGMGQETGI